jgi:hypothetical protein
MRKKSRVRFSDAAQAVYDDLKERAKSSKADKMLLSAIDQKVDFIKINVFYGDAVPKKLIPEEYKVKYHVTSLFRVELPLFWRMLYTIEERGNEVEIMSFVIDILDHPEYSKKFGYKKH